MLNPFDTYSQRIVTKPADIQKEMVIAVKLDSSVSSVYRNIAVPIYHKDNGGIQNHNVRIDWGDGQTTEIEAGIAIPKNTLVHRYSSTGWKTITIISEDGGIYCWYFLGARYGFPYYDGSRSYDNQLCKSNIRYETPILKMDSTKSHFNLGNYNAIIDYIDPYILKNNPQITELTLGLNNYKKEGETKGNTFFLERNILLDVPNITVIKDWDDLLNSEQGYSKDDLFVNCNKLQEIYQIASVSYNFPDRRFPNLFKYCPDLRRVRRSSQYVSGATTEMRDQIHTIPEDLFRNCPKLYNLYGLFSDSVTNLDATNISFTKGGFFAPNWEPEQDISFTYVFCNKVANTLNKSSATEFVNTIKSLGVNYDCEGALYNQTGMVGYSSIPSDFKTNPY